MLARVILISIGKTRRKVLNPADQSNQRVQRVSDAGIFMRDL